MTGWNYLIAGLAGVGALVATANLASAPPLAKLATAKPAEQAVDRAGKEHDAERRERDEPRAHHDSDRDEEHENEREHQNEREDDR